MPNSLKHSRFFSAARLVAALCIGLIITAAASSITAFAQDCDGIRGSVLRLHILANSDSEKDQRIKLAVRDQLLQLDSTLLAGAKSLSEAEDTAAAQLALIEQTAIEELRRQGSTDSARAELVNMYFSTRVYDDFTLPAGYYDAVRVTIGKGEGHNWWCVLYPPLCLPAASDEADISDVLGRAEAEIVKNPEKYRFRFALIELWEKLCGRQFD